MYVTVSQKPKPIRCGKADISFNGICSGQIVAYQLLVKNSLKKKNHILGHFVKFYSEEGIFQIL